MIRRASDQFASNPGSRIHIIYSPSVNPDGTVTLVESGKEDTQDFINSHKDSTDINVIMAKVRAGQVELLQKRPGSYGDFTKMPGTYAEVLNLQISGRTLFDKLPADIKRSFDNDPNVFMAGAGSKEWFNKLSDVLPVEVLQQISPDQFKAAVAAQGVSAASLESEVKSDES